MAVTEEWQAQWNAACVARDKRLAALATAAEMSDEFVTLREECRALGIGMNHSPIVAGLFDSAYKIICGVNTSLEEKHAKLAEIRAFVAEVRGMSPNARQSFTRPPRPAPVTMDSIIRSQSGNIDPDPNYPDPLAAAEALGARFDVGPAEHGLTGHETLLCDGMEKLPEDLQATIKRLKRPLVAELIRRRSV
jgi:hypothetical protein